MIRRLALAALLALAPCVASAQFATIGATPPTSDNSDRLATTQWTNRFFSLGLPLPSGNIFIGSAGNIATATPLGTNVAPALGNPLNDSGGLLTNPHLVVYTVAPSGATTADKSRADFVGDGVNDQNAVNSAVTAAKAISSYSKVVMLPGVYFFSAVADVSGGNGFVFEAEGTQVNGPGVQTATLSALDTFKIQNSNSARFKFGAIVTNSTGAAIHSFGGYIETEIKFQSLDGTGRNGYGILIDSRIASSGQGQSVNWITGTHVENFNVGIALLKDGGTGANIDTYRVTVDFIYNNTKGVYVNSSAGNTVNANVWNINIDASHNAGDIAFETNGFYDVINATIGGLNTGSHNFVLDSGATGHILNLSPASLAVAAGSIVDNSGNATNNINGSSVDGFLNGPAQLVKYGNSGQLVRTGLTLGTIGTANTLTWFSATGVLSSLATANSSILVTNASGVPSWATLGTGNATLLATATGSAGGPTQTIASGATAMGAGAISSATCATVVTATATGTATTDVLTASFNGDPTAVTGYVPLTAGMLTIIAYPTANTANFKVCNNTSSSITPGAITLNWRVVR